MQAIYRDDQKTRHRQEIVTRECGCNIARDERQQDRNVHKAYKLERDYTDISMAGWTCSKTNMNVTV